jgi:hypothetical protein
MVPHVREGLRFAIRVGLLSIDEEGRLSGSLPSKSRPASIGDIADIIKRAGFLGRWLTKIDRSSTVYAYFGVTP